VGYEQRSDLLAEFRNFVLVKGKGCIQISAFERLGCDLFAESNAITKAGVLALGHEPVVGKAVWLAV